MPDFPDLRQDARSLAAACRRRAEARMLVATGRAVRSLNATSAATAGLIPTFTGAAAQMAGFAEAGDDAVVAAQVDAMWVNA